MDAGCVVSGSKYQFIDRYGGELSILEPTMVVFGPF